MTKSEYILPATSIHKLEQIIAAYYSAHKETGIKLLELWAASKNKISWQDHSGSISFLMDLQIIRSGSKVGRHSLTPFGLEFGASLIRHTPETPRYWEAAVRNSDFMMGIYQFIEGAADYIDENSLKNEIVRRAGRTYEHTAIRQAGTLLSVMNKAKLIERYKAGREYRVRVPSSKRTFVATDSISQLEALNRRKLDLSKLIELCKAINECHAQGFRYSTGILTRALLDSTPPIFGVRTFDQVVASHGGTSFKKSMRRLNESARDAYDTYLHGGVDAHPQPASSKQLEVDIELEFLLKEIVKQLS